MSCSQSPMRQVDFLFNNSESPMRPSNLLNVSDFSSISELFGACTMAKQSSILSDVKIKLVAIVAFEVAMNILVCWRLKKFKTSRIPNQIMVILTAINECRLPKISVKLSRLASKISFSLETRRANQFSIVGPPKNCLLGMSGALTQVNSTKNC